jgi:hypothetical protein
MDPHSTPVHLARRRLLGAAAGGAVMAVAASALPGIARAAAAPPEVQGAVPAARLQGRGRLTFLGLRVYDARLWVGERAATPDDWSVPLALELEYLRALQGPKIAERSLEEMRRQGEIAPDKAERWLAAMTRFFPDVKAGDRITGVKLPGELARFYVNGRSSGELRDPEFARFFFGIWLAPQTSQPALRQALLGQTR